MRLYYGGGSMTRIVPVLLAAFLAIALFFSFVVAPAAFRAFPRPDAGRFLGTIFPAYYLTGLILAGAAALILVQELNAPAPGSRLTLRLGLSAFVVLLMAVSLAFLPRIHAMREQLATARTPELEAAFGRAHGISMALNLLAILSALAVLILSIL